MTNSGTELTNSDGGRTAAEDTVVAVNEALLTDPELAGEVVDDVNLGLVLDAEVVVHGDRQLIEIVHVDDCGCEVVVREPITDAGVELIAELAAENERNPL